MTAFGNCEYRYDQIGVARAFGAEARQTKILNQAEDEKWCLAEHFKLHLHPTTMRAKGGIKVNPLPPGVSLEQIYADFFRYLFKHVKAFFQDREINGPQIWRRLERNIELVVAHPNGWGAHEQAFLRNTCVQAGLVSAAQAQARVKMITEGEASVHFVMVHGDMEHRLQVRRLIACISVSPNSQNQYRPGLIFSCAMLEGRL